MKRGFTLIELLTAMVIIGILASIALASYTNAQQKSRDSRRKTDLDAIKKALELAKNDTGGQYYYADCNGSANCGASIASVPLPTRITLAPTYIKTVPKDPKANADYRYVPNPAVAGTATSYSLIACIENVNDTQKDATKDASCSTPASITISPS